MDAVIASAAHDFGCEVSDVHAVRNYESGDPLVREPPLGSTASHFAMMPAPPPLAVVDAFWQS